VGSRTDPTQSESTVGARKKATGRSTGSTWMITTPRSPTSSLHGGHRAPAHLRCSMIVVEKDTPGLTIMRDIPSMHDPDVSSAPRATMPRCCSENVRVPRPSDRPRGTGSCCPGAVGTGTAASRDAVAGRRRTGVRHDVRRAQSRSSFVRATRSPKNGAAVTSRLPHRIGDRQTLTLRAA